ncbi:MAG: 4'-phosphopantetheinyl transferase superfamily protein [bacterium]|nr:4'-phosphopantetheinyl transferase superfamily protein [bacterium]
MVYRTCHVQDGHESELENGYESRYGKRYGTKRDMERAMGRKLLCRAVAIENGICLPKDCFIKKGKHGKPYLADYPELFFNISHTAGSVWLALDEEEIGIDAEHIRPVKESVIEKVLSPQEKEQYRRCPLESRNILFFRFWTLKESFLKAIGIGITVPLSSVSFSFSPCLPLLQNTENSQRPKQPGREEYRAKKQIFISCHQTISKESWYFSQMLVEREVVSLCSKQKESLGWLEQYQQIR